MITNKNVYWEYFPKLLGNSIQTRTLFDELLKELEESVSIYTYQVNGKSYPSTRESCIFMNNTESHMSLVESYNRQIKVIDWEVSEKIKFIRGELEKKFGLRFDYCLAHIYRDGKSFISWHNDKEALNSDVVSVSLGQTRKFRFRKIHQTLDWETELSLKSGDVIWMKKGCQSKYKHCVPKELKVNGCRINLTFRMFE